MDDPPLDLATHEVDDILYQVAIRLSHRFTGVFSPQTVEQCVFECYLDLSRPARIRRHLPALTEHIASDRLGALAHVRGRLDKAVPELLFLCAYNSGRSQIAASLTDRYASGRVHVRCAGSHPADNLDFTVLEALSEWGVQVEHLYPKPLTDDVLDAADVIVTMGCGDACPILTGKRYLDWDIPDPAGKPLSDVRVIRDDIDARVRALVTELTTSGATT